MSKKIFSFLIIVAIIFNITGCQAKEKKRYSSEFLVLFDTVTQITGFGKSEEEFKKYSQLIYDNLKGYHELYDIYNDYEGINNIKTINDNAGIAPVKVDRRIIDLLLFSKEVHEKTNGQTNVAYGAVLKIWHDYRTEGIENPEEAKLPPLEMLQEASNHVDINNLIINEEESTVFLSDSEMRLDVGAVAKGYATEQVAKIAKENGMESALLSVGGNVRAINNNELTGESWKVGIQNPDKTSQRTVLMAALLDDGSLVTSGNYERYYTVEDKKYNHIIDPDTLFPADKYQAVSVLINDSGMADALSTAIFCLSLEEGKELIKEIPGAEAMWILNDGTYEYSENFEKYIKEVE